MVITRNGWQVLERNSSCLKRNEKGPVFHPDFDSFPPSLTCHIQRQNTGIVNLINERLFCYVFGLVLIFSCTRVFILESEIKLIPNIRSWRTMILEHATLEVPNIVALKLAFRWRPCIHCCSLQQGAPLDTVLWPGVAFSNFQGLETPKGLSPTKSLSSQSRLQGCRRVNFSKTQVVVVY